jgi:hypothetical protein
MINDTKIAEKVSLPFQQSVSLSHDDDEQVVLIRKELFTLTGDPFSAVILNQLLYWTSRVKDFDRFLEEEKTLGARVQEHLSHPESYEIHYHGWIYKTAYDLIEETMLGISHPTMRKYLKLLVDRGWIEERTSSFDKWKKATLYRVNINNIQSDLIAIGRKLPKVYLKAFSAALLEAPLHKNAKTGSLNESISNVKKGELIEDSLALPSHTNHFNTDVSVFDGDVRNLHSDENPEETFLSASPKSEENLNARILHSDVKNLHSSENPEEASLPSSQKSEENSNARILHSDARNLHSGENSEESFLTSSAKSEENSDARILHSSVRNLHSDVKNLHSDVKNLHSYTYTENTTENTNREHRAGRTSAGRAGTGAYARAAELDGSDRVVPPSSARVAALMVDLWRRYVNPEAISLTDERKHRLESLLSLHFQTDLRLWESFCLRVKASPFLMGEGKRKWQVTLDWILAKGNILRVLEGNFDDLERIEHQKNEQFKGVQDRETLSLLDSIQDPLWKDWCSQLMRIHPLTGAPLMDGDQLIKAVLTVSELKGITQARFMEFDDRLVWIECFDQKTLNKIEDLRLKFSSVAQATFPKARAVRGHLNLSFNQPQFPQQKGENYAE